MPGTPGSGDNPSDLFSPQLFEDGLGRPLFNFSPTGQGSSSPFQPPFPGGFPLIPNQFGPNPNNPAPITPTNGPTNGPSNIFIWTGGNGVWDSGPNWTPGTSPGAPNDMVQIPIGTVTFNNPNIVIGSLVIGPNGELDIIGGSLTVLNGVTDNGKIVVEGDPP